MSMLSVSLENLSPELLQMIANFLSPSDNLNFSNAMEKTAFLRPDFDQIVITKNIMNRRKHFKHNFRPHSLLQKHQCAVILDIDASAEVNEVLVIFTEGMMPNCHPSQHIKLKKNLFVEEDWAIHEPLSAKKLAPGKISAQGEIAQENDRITVEIDDGFSGVVKANIKIFYVNKRLSSVVSRRVNPLNIISCLTKRNR